MTKRFKLHYYIRNCGDGSASVHLCKSAEEARKLDEESQESEGWGESSNSSETIIERDGKLYFESYRRINGKYQPAEIPLEEIV